MEFFDEHLPFTTIPQTVDRQILDESDQKDAFMTLFFLKLTILLLIIDNYFGVIQSFLE